MDKSIPIPIFKELVLIGGGHSHVAVLKMFAMRPQPGVRITLISPDSLTPYSGMLPGLISGHYEHEETHVDLGKLAQFAQARFIRENVISLDPDKNRIHIENRPPLHYDVLSINTGSTPSVNAIPGADEFGIKVKPVKNFLKQFQTAERSWSARKISPEIAIIGGGAGGTELALSINFRLSQSLDRECSPRIHLFQKEAEILPTHNHGVRKWMRKALVSAQVHVYEGSQVSQITGDHVIYGENKKLPADLVILVTSASPAPWIAQSGLKTTEAGFMAVHESLQSESHENVFGAGDCIAVTKHPRPKSGVFAVRQGAPLARNLRRFCLGLNPKPFRPQKFFLSLISSGKKNAIASYGPFSFHGDWVWKWKDRIDRKWMAQYANLPGMDKQPQWLDEVSQVSSVSALDELKKHPMRCGGCGAKVGKTVLDRVMISLKEQLDSNGGDSNPHPAFHGVDDAIQVSYPLGKKLVQSVDFFPSFIDDPFIFGQIACEHALSDIFAVGAVPHSALVNCVIPFQPNEKQEDTMMHLMAGVLDTLSKHGASLLGGHSSEGETLSIGLTVNGLIDNHHLIPKGPIASGMDLILTKPLGHGILLAAHMKQKIKANELDACLANMLHSNNWVASIAQNHSVQAMTDVTGFGLLGHLSEMLNDTEVDIELDLNYIPILQGVIRLSKAGIVSSLHPENVRLKRMISNLTQASEHPHFSIIFDPQTSGGNLIAIPESQSQSCLNELRQAGYEKASIIGKSVPGHGHIHLLS